jgi:hypothetical protein
MSFQDMFCAKWELRCKEAQAAMNVFANPRDSRSHPAKPKRIASIETGWRNAQRQIASALKDIEQGKPNLPSSEETRKPAVAQQPYAFPEKFIAGNVKFYSMPDKHFYITIQSNFIQVDKNGYHVLGKLTRSQRSLVIMLADNKFFRVTSQGYILDRSNRKVGELSNG